LEEHAASIFRVKLSGMRMKSDMDGSQDSLWVRLPPLAQGETIFLVVRAKINVYHFLDHKGGDG
jgi:hypothetical protein